MLTGSWTAWSPTDSRLCCGSGSSAVLLRAPYDSYDPTHVFTAENYLLLSAQYITKKAIVKPFADTFWHHTSQSDKYAERYTIPVVDTTKPYLIGNSWSIHSVNYLKFHIIKRDHMYFCSTTNGDRSAQLK